MRHFDDAMVAVIFDTETTAKEPDLAKIVQLGVLLDKGSEESPDIIMNALCDPGLPIPPETTEVHGINDSHVEWAPETHIIVDQFINYLGRLPFPVLVGHNIQYYDIPVVANVNEVIRAFASIDTYMMARRMFPDHESHKLADVYVKLGGTMDPDGAHNAVYDCVLNHFVFEKMLEITGYTIEQMWQWSLVPTAFTIMPFGKHKGKKMSDVPSGYLRWCEKNFDNLDIDFQETVDVYVHGKGKDNGSPN